MLDIYAGPTAKKRIAEHGITPELFSTFLGASGGPKWFSLFGLDKYLFGEFFKDKDETLHLIGSSAGAFRSACLAQENPVEAITQLAYRYSETDFTTDSSAAGVSRVAQQMIGQFLPENQIDGLLNNPNRKIHIITTRCRGLVENENKVLQGLGLTKSLINNAIGRQHLTKQYQRVIFSNAEQPLKINESAVFSTETIPLTKTNVGPALLASGAIPMVMEGLTEIDGAPAGMYRDGGIIDYHFDFEIEQPGLTLYPHFNKQPKAGWFDKGLKRTASAHNYDKVVMLVPSDEFIANLPFGKIPDRTDFEKIDTSTRIRYWHKVFEETERLAESFDQSIHSKNKVNVKDLPF